MSFAFLFAGILLLVSGVRGTQDKLFSLVKNDFIGPGNFFYWTLVVLMLGAIGYIRPLRPLSRGFLVLIVVVLLLTRGNPNGIGGGFFAQLMRQLNRTQQSNNLGGKPYG